MSVLLIGETLINEIVTPDGSVQRVPGGSMLNVALGLKSLGRTVRLVTDFGKDADGDSLYDYATRHGIELWLREDAERTSPTTVNHVSMDASGAVSYKCDFSWDIQDRPFSAACKLDLELLDPKSVAFGSAACHTKPGSQKIEHWLDATAESAILFYNPNVRASFIGDKSNMRNVVEHFVGRADVVRASTDDISLIYGEGTRLEDAADRWRERGASLVVITCGPDGAFMFSRSGEIVHIPPRDIEVADTAGAGDAFLAALIDGMTRISMTGSSARAGLETITSTQMLTLGNYASTAAGITVSRPGINPPTREELALFQDSFRLF